MLVPAVSGTCPRAEPPAGAAGSVSAHGAAARAVLGCRGRTEMGLDSGTSAAGRSAKPLIRDL